MVTLFIKMEEQFSDPENPPEPALLGPMITDLYVLFDDYTEEAKKHIEIPDSLQNELDRFKTIKTYFNRLFPNIGSPDTQEPTIGSPDTQEP